MGLCKSGTIETLGLLLFLLLFEVGRETLKA